jgi:hypothetical protein
MRLRVFAAALAAGALALVPLAGAASEAVAAKGTIYKQADGSYILEIEVTGDTIQCMRYTAPQGTTVTSASGPGQTQFSGSVFGSQGTNISAGNSKSWRFTTDKPLTPGARGTLEVSATCTFGSDVTVTLDGPIDVECRCLSFTARILPKSISLFGITDQSLNLGFTIFWIMNCSAGLEGCTGTLELNPPQPAAALGAKLRLVDAKGKLGKATGTFTCEGQCAKLNQGTQGYRLFGKKPLGAKNRANKTYTLTLERTCQGKKVAPLKFKLVFDKLGQVSKKKSDLNADGKPG